MKLKLFILLVLLASNASVAKVDKDFSLAVELENDTLDLSDPNLPKGYDDSRYYFWIKVIITNEAMFPKKLKTWSCSGAGFYIDSDSVRTSVKCRKNVIRVILLQPKETYKVRIPLSVKKDYIGHTLKFRINYPMAAIDWSEFITIKLLIK